MKLGLTFYQRFGIAMLCTALAYVLGIYVVQRKVLLLGPALIGILVVLTGYFASQIGSPIWLIVLMPIPIGFGILYLLSLKAIRVTLLSYAATWAFYLLFHIILSSVIQFDSLIPWWKIRFNTAKGTLPARM